MQYAFAAFVIGLLILVHEAGHFLAARLVRVPVLRFSIGFGPKIIAWRRGTTEYRVSVIPLGGYVVPDIAKVEDYLSIALWRRWAISLGGPLANLLLTVLLFAALNTAVAGFSARNILLAPWLELVGLLGQMGDGLAALFSHPGNVSSVVGVVAFGGQSVHGGLVSALSFFILISANLAIVNMLPLPPLDGGKMVVDLLHRIQPRFARAYVPVMAGGWLLLIGIMAYATVLDVARLV